MITSSMLARPGPATHAPRAQPTTTGTADAPTAADTRLADTRLADARLADARPGPAARTGPTLLAVRAGLWRVLDRSGAVLGHIEREARSDGDRYLARRLVMPTRRIELGAFWRIEDAADCFR